MRDYSLHAVVQESEAMERQILVAISAPMALAVRAARYIVNEVKKGNLRASA